MPQLLCVGVPFLDYTTEVHATAFREYGMVANVTIQAEDRHRQLFQAMKEGTVLAEAAPGGGAATVCVVAAALCRARPPVVCRHVSSEESPGTVEAEKQCEESALGGSEPRVAFLGGVGRDELSETLRELLARDGILPLLSETNTKETGWSATIRMRMEDATDTFSTLGNEDMGTPTEIPTARASSIGAGNDYKLDHLRFKVWQYVEAAAVVYVDAHFLTVSSESARIVAEHCTKMRKVFCVNLGAKYVCGFFREKILGLMPYTRCLFGTEAEYLELAQGSGLREDQRGLDDIVTWLAKLPRVDADPLKRRYIVVTSGSRPVIVASTWQGYGVKVQRYPVPPVKAGRPVCKSGGGDAFAAGFLYGLLCETDLDNCMRCALYAAHVAVQRTGASFVFNDLPEF